MRLHDWICVDDVRPWKYSAATRKTISSTTTRSVTVVHNPTTNTLRLYMKLDRGVPLVEARVPKAFAEKCSPALRAHAFMDLLLSDTKRHALRLPQRVNSRAKAA